MATIASTQAVGREHTGEHWLPTDSWNFTSFFLGMVLEAYIFGMATIATGWVAMPTTLRPVESVDLRLSISVPAPGAQPANRLRRPGPGEE